MNKELLDYNLPVQGIYENYYRPPVAHRNHVEQIEEPFPEVVLAAGEPQTPEGVVELSGKQAL